MSALNLFPARIRFVKQDGTLTDEALKALSILLDRVGGVLGDMGDDTYSAPQFGEQQDGVDVTQIIQPTQQEVPAEILMQPIPRDAQIDMLMQPASYSAGTALQLSGNEFALRDTAIAPATYGTAAKVAQITFDQQGRATLAAEVSIAIPKAQVSGLGTIVSENIGTNFTGSFTGKTVTVVNGIITSVV